MKYAISFLLILVLVGWGVFVATTPADQNGEVAKDNVSMVDGKQVISIQARGGYRPGRSIAKAGVPTVLQFITRGTFDCSSSVRIPSLNISKILPATGSTTIVLGSPSAGLLQGTCGMGMYPFEVLFQS